MIEAVGVVVPAHNEEKLLATCLTALTKAGRALGVPFYLLVMADACTDRTAAIARACGAQVLDIQARRVGAARAAGMTELLRLTAPRDPAAVLYEFGDGPHPHVHGANLGIRGSAYLASGGFRSLRTAEDHALLAAATQAGCSVLRASDITVETSARKHGRAPSGFSQLLLTLAPD